MNSIELAKEIDGWDDGFHDPIKESLPTDITLSDPMVSDDGYHRGIRYKGYSIGRISKREKTWFAWATFGRFTCAVGMADTPRDAVLDLLNNGVRELYEDVERLRKFMGVYGEDILKLAEGIKEKE